MQKGNDNSWIMPQRTHGFDVDFIEVLSMFQIQVVTSKRHWCLLGIVVTMAFNTHGHP